MTPLPQNRCPNCFQAGAAHGNDAAPGNYDLADRLALGPKPAPQPVPRKPGRHTRLNTRINIFIVVLTVIGVVITALMFISGCSDKTDKEVYEPVPNYANWRQLWQIQAHPGYSRGAICISDCIAFAPDGRRAASGDEGGTLILWGEE